METGKDAADAGWNLHEKKGRGNSGDADVGRARPPLGDAVRGSGAAGVGAEPPADQPFQGTDWRVVAR